MNKKKCSQLDALNASLDEIIDDARNGHRNVIVAVLFAICLAILTGCSNPEVTGNVFLTFGSGDVKPAAGLEILLVEGNVVKELVDVASRVRKELIAAAKVAVKKDFEYRRQKADSEVARIKKQLFALYGESWVEGVQTDKCLATVDIRLNQRKKELAMLREQSDAGRIDALLEKHTQLNEAIESALNEESLRTGQPVSELSSFVEGLPEYEELISSIAQIPPDYVAVDPAVVEAEKRGNWERDICNIKANLSLLEHEFVAIESDEAIRGDAQLQRLIGEEFQAALGRIDVGDVFAKSVVARGAVISTRTSMDGMYSFKGIERGEYTLMAEYETFLGDVACWLLPLDIDREINLDLTNHNMMEGACADRLMNLINY